MLSEFESRMVTHLQTYFPEWSQALGEHGPIDFVRHGIARARQYGFEVELDLARYLHVMQALGRDFHLSPEYPWAQDLLMSQVPAAEKMARLRDAVDYQMEIRRICDAK